jgi:hypothetical protein
VFVALPQTDFTLLPRFGFLFECFFHWQRWFGEQAIEANHGQHSAKYESVKHYSSP